MHITLSIGLMIAVLTVSAASGDERVPPVAEPVFRQECSTCHTLFPPQFLPQRSWRKLFETLEDHFGENASLGEPQRQAVLDVLLAYAADGPKAGRMGRKFAQSIAAGQTPLRITETPYWLQKHREIPAARWSSPQVKSKVNCLACHKDAEEGIYEDD
ncbi:MAG: diheme cytochrome c [Candidatus Tectimicrobiota bacterium]